MSDEVTFRWIEIASDIAARCCERVSTHPEAPDLEADLTLQICEALRQAFAAGLRAPKDDPAWVRNYETSLRSEGGPGMMPQ